MGQLDSRVHDRRPLSAENFPVSLVWSLLNPDAVKEHEGHQVTVKGHVDADKNEIHVISLKMAKDSRKKDDMHQ